MAAARPAGATGRRLVVGVAGREGVEHAVPLLERLRADAAETHLVLSPAGAQALGAAAERARALATYRYDHENQAARIASGSFLTEGMVVVPCDEATGRAIGMGLASDLLLRAADVTLKETRPLVVGVAPSTVPEEVVRQLAGLPGVSVVPLEGGADEVADALLAQLAGGAASA